MNERAERGRLDRPPPTIGPSPAPLRWTVYVDLDAYYVACERRGRPELRGRPVIVGPPPTERPTRGVVLSASYEARAFGIHSAQPARAAAALCPEALWIAPDFPKYERISRAVRALLAEFSGEVVPFSIDEAALVVPAPDAAAIRAVAERVQRALADRLELPASLGVATTRLVAKLATDRAKPAGIVVVPPSDVAAFVAPLPIGAVPGVGPKTEERLHARGIERIGEFAVVRPSDAARWLGSFGRELVALARGELEETPIVDVGPRSRSAERTFATDVVEWAPLAAAIRALAGDLARGLAEEGVRYGAAGVALRWADFTRGQRVRAFGAAHEGAEPLIERALHVGRELWEAEQRGAGRAVRTVSVRAERLSERRQRQATLDRFAPAGVR